MKLIQKFLEETQRAGMQTTLLHTPQEATSWLAGWVRDAQAVLVSGERSLQVIQEFGKDVRILKDWRETLHRQDVVGVVDAVLGIAETGTLVLSARDPVLRIASLVPDRLAILVPGTRIVRGFPEALAHLPSFWASYMVFLRGPSVTADIEKQIVHGVHGPRWVSVGIWLS